MSVDVEQASREELESTIHRQAEAIEALEAEVNELRAMVEAYGRQLARVRAAIAGDEAAFWHLDPEEDGGLHSRIELAEAKMDGFAMGLQAVKQEQEGESP